MPRWALQILAAFFLLACAVSAERGVAAPVDVVPTVLHEAEWRAYRSAFIEADGRVIDREKGGKSHSEGQGYGLLLAVYADDRATFDRIVAFTWSRMRLREDGLVSWLYDPRQFPSIVDRNNASDGDLLIAYALVLAALKWDDTRYLAAAAPLIDAIGRHLLETRGGIVRLRPGAFGFDEGDSADGPVVNLSYYVYGAFLMFGHVDSRHPWLETWQSGLRLTAAALTGREGLAPDWITLRRDRFLATANGFAPKSSYDAVRIPLYMALGGRVPASEFRPFDNAWNVRGNRAPIDYDLAADTPLATMGDPGYRAIAALAACAARSEPLPAAIQRFRPTTYFASSLHLLSLAAARSSYPHCVTPSGGVPVASLDTGRFTVEIGSRR
ncbi:glycosyl hydrolase family 8 [Acuticoccus sp. M5D2P5]|uniref:glycosyl hydrolase family 8 n=1 Tax=Acuticoccus kalidii TaxID=2910977 RepID=UPI001F442830|nr:glycosyl hydrolase family 8 [Acuticoccus kalidii]MCF3934280.1 glycosyl hydrolase family 8 [Acuticoccus kalidii]